MVTQVEKEIAVNIFKGFYQAFREEIGISFPMPTKWHIAFIAAIATRLAMDAYRTAEGDNKNDRSCSPNMGKKSL